MLCLWIREAQKNSQIFLANKTNPYKKKNNLRKNENDLFIPVTGTINFKKARFMEGYILNLKRDYVIINS
jgi:hypothetical protein